LFGRIRIDVAHDVAELHVHVGANHLVGFNINKEYDKDEDEDVKIMIKIGKQIKVENKNIKSRLVLFIDGT
jgi:hypothetical protein